LTVNGQGHTTLNVNGQGDPIWFGELALIYPDGADTICGFDPKAQQVAITP
jgi:hypothetical protein